MLKVLFNKDWYFKKGEDIPEKIDVAEYEKISLPHTYNNVDGQDGGDDYYRGYAIYAKEFSYQQDPEHPVSILEFNGVGQSAELYLNGTYLGNHHGGYSIFRFDISEHLKENNILVVRVENTINEKVYPQMADFTFYGGIYRDVYFLQCKKEHFDLMDHGSNGVIVTPSLKDGKALVEVEAWTTGGSEVEIHIGELKSIAKIENNHAKTVVEIDNPHLWDGLEDPYLYNLKARLLLDNEVKDEINIKFGIREFKVDPDKGFILNGRQYPLRGVAKHQDRLGVGNAVSRNDLDEDMRIIKELGATTIRLSHYQHDQFFYDLCDENGMIVWAEIPYISRHMHDGKENTLSQMEELIKQNYNHPSIVCWGLSNEITIGGGAESDSLLNNHRELNDLAHKLDKTRLTTMAHVMSQDPHGSIIDIPDIASYNLYFGWYAPDTNKNAQFFDKFHEEHPNHCIGLSEYGADASTLLHSAKPKRGDYTEEYQCLYHEDMIKIINDREYLWATHVWNMFDFAADARREGGCPGRNQKGLVTMDRKIKKDSFYLYKAYWNKKEEFVHICSRRYVNRCEDISEIKVYSNVDEVSLFVDGQLFEKQKGEHIFKFNVPISSKHHIEAKTNNCHDEIDIVHVDTEDESYILKDSGAMNWFNEEELKDDHFSINDTLGDLLANPACREMVKVVMENVIKDRGDLAQAANQNESLMEMMSQMALSSLLTLSGGAVSNDDIKKLNNALQEIKK